MSTPQQVKENAMAKISGVMTAIDMYPNTTGTSTLLSYNISTNPIDLLVDFFKQTKGHDAIVDIISKFISTQLPILEVSVKGILLTNIQSMLSCSIKPVISERMITEGVVFDVNKIDLFNILSYSPILDSANNVGKYYYFDCDKPKVNSIDDVRNSDDFNAVLWYCKQTPSCRVVWKSKKDKEANSPYNISHTVREGVDYWTKQPKSNGIVTVEYNTRSTDLTNCRRDRLYIQEPIENCIHVFFGCTAPVENKESLRNAVAEHTDNIKALTSISEIIDEYLSEVDIWVGKMIENYNTQINSVTEINGIIAEGERCKNVLKGIKSAIYNTGGFEIGSLLDNVDTFVFDCINKALHIPQTLMVTNMAKEESLKIDALQALDNGSETHYPPADTNYYHRRLMSEFNTDFVMSMKLFDEKTVTAQLLDALTNCLKYCGSAVCGGYSGLVGANVNGNINMTVQQQFVQAQVRELVTKLIETDDSVISDCFFSFTNETYNALLQEVEMSRAGLQTNDGTNANTIPSPETIMSSINELSVNASKEELRNVVKGSIYKAVSCTNPHEYGSVDTSLGFDVRNDVYGDGKVNLNLIDQLLTKLVYVIVMAIMSPKVYILMAMNLKAMGQTPNFDLNKFMVQFKSLIGSLVRGVRDQILEYLRVEMYNVMKELSSTLAMKMSAEQYEYHIALLLKCAESVKLYGNEYDWAQDDVNYADITDVSESINQDC